MNRMKEKYPDLIERYIEAFEIIGDPVSIQDLDYRVLYQNKAHIELVGSHLGAYCYEAYEKRSQRCDGCPVAVTFKDGSIHKTERSAPVGDGYLYVEITSSPIRDSKGNIVAGVEVARDITAQKKAEQLLRESEKKFRQLAESIMEVFWIVSPTWEEVHYISPAYQKVWGKSCQSLIESPMSWFDSIVAEDKTKVSEAIGAIDFEKDERVDFPEYRIERSDGEVRWILARGFPLRGDDGAVEKVAGVAFDITQQKSAEIEKVRLIQKLQKESEKVRVLTGLIPICAACKQIRDDKGFWNQMEKYISEHSEAVFSHSLCPGCVQKLYPDLGLYNEKEKG